MANPASVKIQNINSGSETAPTVDVLYQKLNGRWYAFSLVGEEVFMGSVSESEINNAAAQGQSIEKIILPEGTDNSAA